MNPVALGLLAGAFTTFASLPQIVYVLRTRSMKDISIVTLGMFAFGVTLWLAYGFVIHAAPVVIWNALSLCLYLTQIGLKLVFSPQGSSFMAHLRRTLARLSPKDWRIALNRF